MAEQNKKVKDQWHIFSARFSDFSDMLRRESERGSVIISAALIDEALEKMLKAKLVPASKPDDDELFNGHYAPLSGFSAKIDFAYRVGVIGFNIRKSLHLIRKLRNDFAHSPEQLNFQSQEVHSRIKDLFGLNEKLLDAIWESIDSQKDQRIMKIIGSYKSKSGVDCLSKIWGWRSTFELLCSIVSASLSLAHERIEPLLPLDAVIPRISNWC